MGKKREMDKNVKTMIDIISLRACSFEKSAEQHMTFSTK